jgi:hypothetical protein
MKNSPKRFCILHFVFLIVNFFRAANRFLGARVWLAVQTLAGGMAAEQKTVAPRAAAAENGPRITSARRTLARDALTSQSP